VSYGPVPGDPDASYIETQSLVRVGEAHHTFHHGIVGAAAGAGEQQSRDPRAGLDARRGIVTAGQ
jgi:hypothetical protein